MLFVCKYTTNILLFLFYCDYYVNTA